jgi:formate hydrogenlyase subunit 4
VGRIIVTVLAAVVTQLLHMALMLAAAPGLVGLIRWVEARLQGRSGPPPSQRYRDLERWLRKQPVIPETASPLFEAAPPLYFAAVAAAAFLVPSFASGMATAPIADLLLIAGLLASSRVVLALAGLDVGTAFGGIGASRGMAYAALAEPALFLVIFTLGLFAGTTNLDGIAVLVRDSWPRVSFAFALVATGLVAVADMGRTPIGNPMAQSELSMLQEASVQEYSGRHLALIDFAAALKVLLWLTLIAATYAPYGMAPAASGPLAWAVGLVAWAGKILVLALGLVLLEMTIASMRAFRVPKFLSFALVLALLAAVFLFVAENVT